MKVILLENILHKGVRRLVGAELELSDEAAKRLIKTKLAAEFPVAETKEEATIEAKKVSAPKRERKKKAE